MYASVNGLNFSFPMLVSIVTPFLDSTLSTQKRWGNNIHEPT